MTRIYWVGLSYACFHQMPTENRWWDVLPIVASDSEASVDVAQEVTVPEVRLFPLRSLPDAVALL